MKAKRFTVTCRCPAYDFPHRVDGGKCTGSDWAEAYAMIKSTACQQCNANAHLTDRFSCDVIDGRESIKQCEGFQDFKHSHNNEAILLPIEQYLENLQLEYR